MTEFSKIKLPFALALLAVMFAINPLINKYGNISYSLFSLPISINFIYIILCSLLAASVYFYAIGLIGEKPIFGAANKIGHITYALALIALPLFILLYPVSLLATIVIKIWHSPALSNTVEYTLSFLMGLMASIISILIVKAFSQRDKTSKIEYLTNQENHLLARARQFFQQGYFDIAVTEVWKALEVALAKTLIAIGEKRRAQTAQSLLELTKQRELLSNNQIKELMYIRKIRNEAIHTERHVNSDEALRTLSLSDKIIASLEKAGDTCYFCNRFFPVDELETDDITGASVCRNCAKKNPDWKAELIVMGMDS